MKFFNLFKKKEIKRKFKQKYIYCQSITEGAKSFLHIRYTSTEKGPQYISGIDTESLCKLIGPSTGGFDYPEDVNIAHRFKICPMCFTKYSEMSITWGNFDD